MRKICFYVILCFLFILFPAFSLYAQTSGPIKNEIKGGYRAFKLGMDLELVKKLLKEDVYFAYRGDPDISFLPITEEPLIACDGNSFIKRGYFQFHEKKLFIIIIVLDEIKLDYFTLYTALTTIYGKSTALSPTEVVWESNEVRLSLERPLTVKYIATAVFNSLKASNKGEADYLSISKKDFLEQF